MSKIEFHLFFIKFLILLFVCIDSGLSQRCGRSNNSTRIVGGTTARRLNWPWMALLTMTFQSSSSNKMARCGGSLISEEWVLTAAHCVYPPSGYRLNKVEITLGEHDITRIEGTESVTHGSQVLTKGYNPSITSNDIALIKLREKLDFKGRHKHLQPICLPSSGLKIDGNQCYATGWGTTSPGGRSATILQEVQLPIVDNRICSQVWSKSFNSENQLCAGHQQGGRDTCQGDSGGPLNCQLSNGVWVQEGITSFGAGCAKPGSPGVYTRVSAYVPWIQSHIS